MIDNTSYERMLLEFANRDERLVVMTAENRSAIRGLPASLGSRFIDVGICEQTMIGAAAGLALRGRIPVAHALACFLTMRAFEFIRTDVGIGGLPVKLVGAVPGFLSEANGPTHQAVEDVALMRGVPGMGVFCPADVEELVSGMPVILDSKRPFYVRYTALAPAVAHRVPFAIGKAERISSGSDVAILTYGLMVREADRARRRLEDEGCSVRLVSMRTLKPIDEDEVVSAARETRLLVTLEDHFQRGGLFSIVAEILVSRGLTSRVLPLALEERWFSPGLLDDVLEIEGFTGDKIATKIAAALR
jgi:transketolase